MFEILYLFKTEFRFFFHTKRNYIQQTILQIIESVIFLVGMMLTLSLSEELHLTLLIRVAFWFCLIHSFIEMANRIESEMRLKQFSHNYSLHTSFWIQSCVRLIPILLESLLIVMISFFITGAFEHFHYTFSIWYIAGYGIVAFFQYVILNMFLLCFALRHQRIQALLGFIEFFLFFYSGMVMREFSLPFLTWMNELLIGNGNHLHLLALSLVMECILFVIYFTRTNQKLKLRGA